MRKTSRLVTLAVTGLALAAPQVLPELRSIPPSTPPQPAPVEASYQELALDGPSVAAGTKPFTMVGITWPSAVEGAQAKVRVERAGQWTEWEPLRVEDEHGPDPSVPARSGTEPLWVGDATGVQASAVTLGGATVGGAKVVLIQPGVLASDSGSEPGVQGVEPEATRAPYPMPAMVSRKAWGADERLRSHNGKSCARPKYTTTVQAAFVHHTADRNDYTRTQVPAMVRGWLKQRINALIGGSVSTPIYRFAKSIGFRSVGQPFWGEHRTKTGWATYFATSDVFHSVATGTHSTVGVFRARYRQTRARHHPRPAHRRIPEQLGRREGAAVPQRRALLVEVDRHPSGGPA